MLTRILIIALILCWPAVSLAEGVPQPAGKKEAVPQPAGKTVTLETNMGKMVIELYDKQAPLTVANFRRYVKESYYNGLIFHRVVPGPGIYVIQGGGFEPGMKVRQPPHPAIKNEATNGLLNQRGTLSMARTNQVDSATSQFFINLKHNLSLDNQGTDPARFGYAVFGKVIEGLDVVDKIAKIPTGQVKGFKDVPQQDVIITKAYENGSQQSSPTSSDSSSTYESYQKSSAPADMLIKRCASETGIDPANDPQHKITPDEMIRFTSCIDRNK